MKKIISIFTWIVIPFILFSQDFSTYESRREAVLSSLEKVALNERGKHGLPKAIARLWNNSSDSLAINYITNILDHEQQSMFDFPGVALALCRYKDSFNDVQIQALKADLEARCIEQNQYGMAGFLGHGTENHATMMWCSGYLFGQLFPDAKWANGMTSEELMKETKERLRTTFKNVYKKGYVEYLSTTYEIVMNFPVAILLEYAEDPEMKEIARAFLLYKWSLLSLNNFDGYIIPPYGRMNTEQDFDPKGVVSATNYYTWLLWGWGSRTNNVDLAHFQQIETQETSYGIYAALSEIIPDKIFFDLASHRGDPYTLKSSASTFGSYGSGASHMMMRKLYRDSLYAIGTGNFRWVPGGDYADHDTNSFGIVWNSTDHYNSIGCYHPYWYSDGDDEGRTPDTWYKGNISPFQQTTQHKNTVITLFDIPDKDPWMNLPSSAKWAWRDGHANNLIKRGMLRYPKSVDEKKETNGWIFLREDEVYIGIKPLKSYYEQSDLTGKGLDEFNVVKSDHAKTGFLFELGEKEEFGNFEKFQKQLVKNKLLVDWENMRADYTDSQGDRIVIQYQSGLPIQECEVPDHLSRKGIKGLAASVPKVTINGENESYTEWPMIESPFIKMENSILKIGKDKGQIIVDWSGDLPAIKRLD